MIVLSLQTFILLQGEINTIYICNIRDTFAFITQQPIWN